MGKHTPFYDLHLQANAKMVDFAGWDMPLHYGSQIKEHHQVRQHSGIFDVSHMGIVDLEGDDATTYLRRLLANNIDKISEGKALYTCMLNDQGGVLDDLIVYKISPRFFRIIVNAGTREKDIAWMQKQVGSLRITLSERHDLVMLAIQGPETKDKVLKLFPHQKDLIEQLKPFSFAMFDDIFIARTGYTGEDGYEIIFPAKNAANLWQSLLQLEMLPCGLGARDTLRLEAGLNLYGTDMDESVTPFEANLGWTVSFEPKERNFIGREALERQQQQGIKRSMVGLILEGPGIIRNHQKVFIDDNGQGEVTSGGYSPTLEKSIAFARIPAFATLPKCSVEIRNKQVPASIVKPPFVRKGKKLF